MLIHLLIFVPTFPFSRVAGAAAPGLEIPHVQQQSQIVLLAPHQDGTKKSQRCIHSTWSLNELWTAVLWVWTSVFQPFCCSGTFPKFCVAHGSLRNDPSFNRIESWLRFRPRSSGVTYGGRGARRPPWQAKCKKWAPLLAYISDLIFF